MSTTIEGMKIRFAAVKDQLNEKGKRLFGAGEAQAYGWGGKTVVAKAIGISRKTIAKGVRDLEPE